MAETQLRKNGRGPQWPGEDEPQNLIKGLKSSMSYRGESETLDALYKIIQDHLKVPATLWQVLSFTRFEDIEVANAVQSMIDRGMRRMSKAQRADIDAGKMPFSQMPYPMRIAMEVCVSFISVDGRGRQDVVDAITGIPRANRNPDDNGHTPMINISSGNN